MESCPDTNIENEEENLWDEFKCPLLDSRGVLTQLVCDLGFVAYNYKIP